MAVRHHVTSVGTSATVISGTQYPGFLLRNNGSATVFLGDTGVTTANGFPIEAGGVFSPDEVSSRSLTGKNEDRLFGVCASGTVDVRVLVPGRINV